MTQNIVELKSTAINPVFDQLTANEKIKILTQLAQVSKEFVESVNTANIRKQDADR